MTDEIEPREAEIERTTGETDVRISLGLDGDGTLHGSTGVGFFDHMLELLARHGRLSLKLDCTGDLHVDSHHTVEDVGICLGRALLEALGDKKGVNRYGLAYVPMDECLARCVVDLSGRASYQMNADLGAERVGDLEVELVWEFFRALSTEGRFNLHLDLLRTGNAHHAVEACFKAVGRALAQASMVDPTGDDTVPSTKGVL